MWQEWVFTIGSVVFMLTLWPTMRNAQAYVPRLTSAPIAVMLSLYVIAFVSLGLIWSAVFTWGTAACWTFINIRRGSKPKKGD